MFKTDSLVNFIHVAQLGSITAAAKHKNLTTMAVSKQITNLEALLGQALFERTRRQMKLTEFGQAFLKQSQAVVEQHHALDNWLAGQKNKISGTIRVLSQTHEMYKESIIPWLKEFCDRYPEVQVELDVKESIIDIDIDSFDVYWGISDYLGEQAPSLKRRFLWGSKYGVYASPEYLQRHGQPTTPEDLDEHYVIGYLHNKPANVLVLQQKSSSGEQQKKLKDHQTQPLYKMLNTRVKTVSGLVELAESGLGLINAVGEEQSVKSAVNEGRLVPVLQDYWCENADVFIYYHNVKHEQPKVRAFIDFFLEKRQHWNAG